MKTKALKLGFAGGLLALVTACSMPVGITGGTNDGSETFSGSGTAAMSKSAPFTMTTSKGTSCSGAFVMEGLTKGVGDLTCADGRTGFFTWTSKGGAMTGVGEIGGVPMTITMK